MEISVSSTCPWICVLCPIVSHPKARDHILFIPTPFTTASRSLTPRKWLIEQFGGALVLL